MNLNLREEFQKNIEDKKVKIDEKLVLLKAKANQTDAKIKVKYLEEIEALHQKKNHVEKQLEDLKESGEGAFDHLKMGVEKAWQELSDGVEAATAKFK